MKVLGADYVYYDVSDLKKSTAFYRDVLGLKVSTETPDFIEFDLGNITLAIGNYDKEKPEAIKQGPAIALAVDDVPGALSYLKSKGVHITHDLIDTDVCHMAIIADIDGNQIILHKRKDGTVG